MSKEIRFDGQVAIVTGAGNGLGKSHALMLASRGAKVVVNDLGGDIHGDGNRSSAAADAVVDEIKAAGGEAVANYDSVIDGDKIVKTAVDNFGTVDILINNAGILRDVSFAKMTDNDWDLILQVHLQGTYKVTHAVWPIMKAKGYGRIVMTTSAAGIYGNFGQANYCAAKLGIAGLAGSLAIEGRRNNICVNTIAPIAGSRLTETVMPEELLEKLKPEYVSPLVGWLVSDQFEDTGGIYEVGAGYVGKLRWERTTGGIFNTKNGMSPEQLSAGWDKVTDFEVADHPANTNDAFAPIMDAMNNPPLGGNEFIDLDKASGAVVVLESSYDENDLALYALGIGAARDPNDEQELAYVYEMDSNFQAFPTYGVMPQSGAMLAAAKEGTLELPGSNFGFDRLLHGEQFTEIKRPLPKNAKLKHSFKMKEAYDKDPNAIVIYGVSTTDAETGEELVYNEMTAFVKGAGGWGGDRGPSSDINTPPDREPDAVIEEQTDVNQTLLYRLSGDWNPLHADPAFAKAFGFDKPILHGLCTFGYCGRHVVKAFANNDGRYFKNIKVRFAKSVYPGDTLVTKMWKDSDTRIIFETSVKERDEVVIKNAAIELYEEIPVAEAKPAVTQQSSAAVATTSSEPGVEDVVTMLSDYVAAHPDLASGIGRVFQWNVKNPDLDFVLDLKNGEGSVTVGTADNDCSIEIDEDNLMAMMRGEGDAQKLYFAGKLKIGGDIMASQKLQFLADMDPAETQASLAAVVEARGGGAAPAAAAASTEPGGAEVVAILRDYVAEHPELASSVGRVFQWHVKNPDLDFVLDLKNGDGAVTLGTADNDCSIEIDEDNLMAMMRGEGDAQKLYFAGKLKIGGDIMASQKLQFLADMDPAETQASLKKALQNAAPAAPAAAASTEPGGAEVVAILSDYVAEHPELASSVGRVFQWHVKNPDLDFVLDLKNGDGAVTLGTADNDCSIEIDEDNLMAMMRGEGDAQKLYFAGKLKIGGDIMASQKLQFLADMDPAETQASLNKALQSAAPAASQPANAKVAKEPLSPKIFAALEERLAAEKLAANGASGVLQFNVTDTEASWTLDLSGDAAKLTEGGSDTSTTIFGIEDADLAALVAGEAEVRDLYQRGKLRVDGDVSQARELGFFKGLI